MTRVQREMVSLGVLVAALLVVALWSVSWMAGQRSEAVLEAGSLERSRELVSRIALLREEPAIASAEDVGVQELGAHVESAMGRAGVASGRLEGIYPQPSRRLGTLPYELKPTTVSLRAVTLRQLLVFLHELMQRPGLNVSDLSLTTPSGGEAGQGWDVQATLTYLIFTPAGEE